jgi:Zn-dependent M28 family amino/carboxypeptidase
MAPREPFPADAEFYFKVLKDAGAAAIVAIASPRTVQSWNEARKESVPYRDLMPNVPSAYSSGGDLTMLLVKPGAIDTLHPGTVTIKVPTARREVMRGYNVVGRLPGADARRRNEYVTVAAHLDGAVIENYPVKGDSVYNAADDNASGSVGLLNVAEQLAAAPRAKRSMVFIWDSGEEIGLYGTRAFVGEKVVAPKDIVTHFNLDMIGASRRPGTADSANADVTLPNEVFVTGPRVLSAGMDSLVQRVNRAINPMQLNFRHDDAANEFFYPRTDAGPFLERGVLVVELFTGLHERYHSPQDEVQHLDPAKIQAVSRLLLGLMHTIADADRVPVIDKAMPASVPRY